MLNQPEDGDEVEFYSKSDDGLCLLKDEDLIVNPQNVSLIRKIDGKTLIYRPGVAAPEILPLESFDQLRHILFSGEAEDDYLFSDDDDDLSDDDDD
ncbi:MAG: hypothetical protein LBU64_06060 [Planctomycetota bacterium]|jgi:hypothetical protein|nr:hypothetical protein [Planctomycetota bacterium]